jgi:Fe2+ transport system protein FeoA
MKRLDMPLTCAPTGETVTVKRIRGGCGGSERLKDLGIIPGCRLQVVNSGQGPLILRVRESRMALGRGLADRIMVGKIFTQKLGKPKYGERG